MQEIILLLHVLVAVCLVGLILIQHGKGADVGAAFGSGASNTMFGSQGSGSFLVKVTASLAAIFFVTSMTLSYLATRQPKANATAFEQPVPISRTLSTTKSPSKDVKQTSHKPSKR